MDTQPLHLTHPEISKRLKRAEGHLKTIIAMIQQERSCLEIAQQLHAVEKAICSAKKTLIQDHIDHCLTRAVDESPRGARAQLEEFREIAKYL